MQKKQFWPLIGILALTLVAAVFCFPQYVNNGIDLANSKLAWKIPHLVNVPFKLGLDVKGGIELEYQADLSSIPENQRSGVMAGLRDLIERRINVYGVAEPLIQSSGANRLIGMRGFGGLGRSAQAVFDKIKQVQDAVKAAQDKKTDTQAAMIAVPDYQLALQNPYFKDTDLTGKYLKKASLTFNQTTGAPEVDLQFDDQGAKIFEDITGRNVGKQLAIYLDGASIVDTNGDGKIDGSDLYAPRINEKISGGKAVITGITAVSEAKTLVARLNEGALPVPLGQPISQEKIGPTLGAIPAIIVATFTVAGTAGSVTTAPR